MDCSIWAKIITIKRTTGLNYFSLCALNLFNTQVSQFELNYWNIIYWDAPVCVCVCIYIYIYIKCANLFLLVWLNKLHEHGKAKLQYLNIRVCTSYFVKNCCTNYISIKINQHQTIKNFIWLLSEWSFIYTKSRFISWSECSHTYFMH